METSVWVALLALFGTIVTVTGGVVVAIITSNKDSKASAETALEKSLRERILLRDEKIEELKEDLAAERASKTRLEEALRESVRDFTEYKMRRKQRDDA